ncbi:hypothetical protein STEG23_025252 [Scotinomys teguina]
MVGLLTHFWAYDGDVILYTVAYSNTSQKNLLVSEYCSISPTPSIMRAITASPQKQPPCKTVPRAKSHLDRPGSDVPVVTEHPNSYVQYFDQLRVAELAASITKISLFEQGYEQPRFPVTVTPTRWGQDCSPQEPRARCANPLGSWILDVGARPLGSWILDVGARLPPLDCTSSLLDSVPYPFFHLVDLPIGWNLPSSAFCKAGFVDRLGLFMVSQILGHFVL